MYIYIYIYIYIHVYVCMRYIYIYTYIYIYIGSKYYSILQHTYCIVLYCTMLHHENHKDNPRANCNPEGQQFECPGHAASVVIECCVALYSVVLYCSVRLLIVLNYSIYYTIII